MKRIYLNLKRFDVPVNKGGINNLSPIIKWGSYIVNSIQKELREISNIDCEITIFPPEAHLISMIEATTDERLFIGSQSVHFADVEPGYNFGAFTSSAPAASFYELGCRSALIGHSEERKALFEILEDNGLRAKKIINNILQKKCICAARAGMNIVFCVGETLDERNNWQNVISDQLSACMINDVDRNMLTIAYEPIWAIGPGKTLPRREEIAAITEFIKALTDNLLTVYGGGLKEENASMLASIPSLDGGLIALTRFGSDFGFYPDEFIRIIRKYMGV